MSMCDFGCACSSVFLHCPSARCAGLSKGYGWPRLRTRTKHSISNNHIWAKNNSCPANEHALAAETPHARIRAGTRPPPSSSPLLRAARPHARRRRRRLRRRVRQPPPPQVPHAREQLVGRRPLIWICVEAVDHQIVELLGVPGSGGLGPGDAAAASGKWLGGGAGSGAEGTGGPWHEPERPSSESGLAHSRR